MYGAWLDFVEGFLTVFVAAFTAASFQGDVFVAPNYWALTAGALGGILAGVRKVQARRASPPGV